jgi:hypothetical protein
MTATKKSEAVGKYYFQLMPQKVCPSLFNTKIFVDDKRCKLKVTLQEAVGRY